MEIETVAPDGGWGWFVAAGSAVVGFLAPLLVQVFSILYSKLLMENNTSSTTIFWMFNMKQFCWSMMQLFVPALSMKFGLRKVAFTGGIIVFLSTILSTFATSTIPLFFTMSFYGIGASMALTVVFIIVPQYFKKLRGRMFGLVTFALCSGQFCFPLLVRKLQGEYGHEMTVAIIAALLFNICVSAALFQPVERHNKKVQKTKYEMSGKTEQLECEPFSNNASDNSCTNVPKDKLTVMLEDHSRNSIIYGSAYSIAALSAIYETNSSIQKTNIENSSSNDCLISWKQFLSLLKIAFKNAGLLRQYRVLILTVSLGLTSVIYVNFLMLIPFVVINKGHDIELAAFCITLIGITNAAIRLIISSLTDVLPMSCKWFFMGGSLTVAASFFAFASITSANLLLVSSAVYGIGIGSCICLYTLLIIEFMGMDLMPATYGTYGLVCAILSITAMPLIGYIRDSTQDYEFCLKLLSILQVISFILFMLVPIAIKYDMKREERSKIQLATTC